MAHRKQTHIRTEPFKTVWTRARMINETVAGIRLTVIKSLSDSLPIPSIEGRKFICS